MVMAMLYTLLADVIPVAERATAFFHVGAAYLVSQMISAPLAGALMINNPWVPFLVALTIMALCIPTCMCFPETMDLHEPREQETQRQTATAQQTDDSEACNVEDDAAGAELTLTQKFSQKARESIGEVLDFVLLNKRISFLMLSAVFVILGKFVSEMLLQYATKRYGWTWSRATVLLAISGAASLVTLLAVLPFASWFCLSRLGMPAVAKDITLARLSGFVSIVGCLIIALAPNGYVASFGLVWLSLGTGISSLTRSLINALVEEHHVGIANTLFGLMEMCGIIIAGPLVAESLSTGMRWGGAWLGLPFITGAGFFAVATTILYIFRPAVARTSPGQHQPTIG